MASSTYAVSTAVPLTQATTQKTTTSASFLKPLPLPVWRTTSNSAVSRKFEVRASLKEKVVMAATAVALTASMVVPDLAEGVSGVSPSLKNFLLSIIVGGVVLSAIIGSVVGVSNFDPVKRS